MTWSTGATRADCAAAAKSQRDARISKLKPSATAPPKAPPKAQKVSSKPLPSVPTAVAVSLGAERLAPRGGPARLVGGERSNSFSRGLKKAHAGVATAAAAIKEGASNSTVAHMLQEVA